MRNGMIESFGSRIVGLENLGVGYMIVILHRTVKEENMANHSRKRKDKVDIHVMALKEADIILKPAGHGPGIPTHKALLVTISNILKICSSNLRRYESSMC